MLIMVEILTNMHKWMKRLFSSFENSRGIWFHIVGIVALIWFLMRSGTAPHRSQYPCQQLARNIAAVYMAYWSALFVGIFMYFKKVKTQLASFIPLSIIVFLIINSIGNGIGGSERNWQPIAKQPMGEPVGLNPGRVVWVWNPYATRRELHGYWWERENNNQSVIDEMFEEGIKALAGTDDIKEAWNLLFKYFNRMHGKGNVSYQKGEKIAIKINMNNCWDARNNYAREDNDRDANPYVVKALLRQLVNVVGVAQEDIILYDASRPIPDWFYYRVIYKDYPVSMELEFPYVKFYDEMGGGEGRIKVEKSDVRVYFAYGPCKYRTLPKCVVEADYLINMPLLKMHPINNGVTLSGKNLFGSWIEEVKDIHEYHEYGQIMGNPAPQVDLLAHEQLGGKTLLYIGDGTFGTIKDHKTIARFQMYPFNDDWTNSLFFSQDPVAIDSVMFDFLNEEANPIEGAQNYLHQAAEPPAGVYDPEGDGIYLNKSLGVHEHWDTSVNIFSPERYSGREKGGIDFVAIGKEYAQAAIRVISPQPNHIYIFGKDVGMASSTIVIGSIIVECRVEGLDVATDKVEFYVNDEFKGADTTQPYTWEWNDFSFGKYYIKFVAYYRGGSIEREMELWKFL